MFESSRRRRRGSGDLPPRLRFDNVGEADALARRRLPRPLYEQLMSGAERGLTLAENIRAFEDVGFVPRGAAAGPSRDLTTEVLGTPISQPVLLGPVGALRLFHPRGVVAAATAAARSGTIVVSSPAAGHTIQEVAEVGAPTWLQLSVSGGREAAENAIAVATTAGVRALVVTVDSAVKPKQRAVRIDARSMLEFGPDLVRHPRWTAGFIRDGTRLNVANAALGTASHGPLRAVVWDDFRWIREAWNGPIVVKGVTSPDDARRAVDAGAAAVVVSNHGGLALDGAPATLRVLPGVVEAIGDSVEVLLDGGVRYGSDVVKALGLGARAVLLGRAYVLGLAVGGAAGVERMLGTFRVDIDRTLALLGCPTVRDLDPSYVEAHWPLPDRPGRR
jgi:isopentenyl diphosphate isomerase/L-lactate dehydrogenase-like FMN-dependent dehydrogenase